MSPSIETGNANIDVEHKIFFNQIRKLISSLNSGPDAYYLTRLALEIQKYAEFHFVSEENLMIDIGFPDFDEHQKKHLKLLERFNITLNYVELGRETYEGFISFLVDWFKSHTVEEDKKIADFLKSSNNFP